MPSLPDTLQNFSLEKILPALSGYFLAPETWIQFGIVLGAILLSWFLAARIRAFLAARPHLIEKLSTRVRTKERIHPFRIVLLIVLWIATFAYDASGAPCTSLKVVNLLFTGFMLVVVPAKLIKGKFWLRTAALFAFLVAALYNLGAYDSVVTWLANTRIPLVPSERTLLDFVRGTVTLVALLWLAGFLTRTVNSRVDKLPDIPPTVRVLLGKIAHFSLYAIALIISIQAFGIPLGALAIFGGALGLGVGFGLQKVVSNLFSGLIILFDKSIKPGDVIEISGTYGWVNSLRTRYISIITRDNKEHLIPNEDLITQPVVNWSFSNRLVRLKAPVGIAYGADVRKAIELCTESAASLERVLSDPAPRCLLRGFGDNSIDLEIRFWINDPSNGTANITSDVLLGVWDRFQENKIEIPFPQRDIHIRSSTVPVPVPLPPNPDNP